ncbi:MAG: TetR family transcriptional regulator [Labilithrix sp.]|nr:TetR family transcriptional regulator [Labilithrix sp.]MBX3224332.1 TetR family transcriptional regulator [Labilithrix sp.]
MSQDTRGRIVDAAIQLFNARGVGAVTTNHVAAHLKISPGNLYYHFRNKEEIVREAFDRMNAEADAVWRLDDASDATAKRPAVDPTALQRMLVGNLKLYARYLFFARELPSLLRSDPVLHERYAAVSARRVDQLESVMLPLVDAGLLRDVGDREDLRTLVESAWMVGLFCIPYAETIDASPAGRTAKAQAERTHAAIERGALLVLHMFKPYMDPLAYVALVVIVRTELEKLTLR